MLSMMGSHEYTENSIESISQFCPSVKLLLYILYFPVFSSHGNPIDLCHGNVINHFVFYITIIYDMGKIMRECYMLTEEWQRRGSKSSHVCNLRIRPSFFNRLHRYPKKKSYISSVRREMSLKQSNLM